MKILYVIPGPPTGFSQIFAKRQAKALAAAGIQIEAFHIKTWKSIPTLISEYVKLSKVVKQRKPDIIHARYGTMTAALCALMNWPRFIITFAGSDLNPMIGNVLRRYFGLLLSQVAAYRAHRIICVSDHMRKRLWWKSDEAFIIPDGVDMRLFRPMNRIEARRHLGWELSERTVLFNVGYNPVLKGEELGEAAISVARSLSGPIRLVKLYGNIAPDVMPFYYNAADCLLVASLSEGSPNVIKEAMACNLPIVSTRVGDVEERLREVQPSFITDRDPGEMGPAISKILQLNLRSNGREKVKDVSLENTTKQYMQVYASML